jgi:hypothetical protein
MRDHFVGADARLTMLPNRAVEPFSALGAIREGAVKKLIGLP